MSGIAKSVRISRVSDVAGWRPADKPSRVLRHDRSEGRNGDLGAVSNAQFFYRCLKSCALTAIQKSSRFSKDSATNVTYAFSAATAFCAFA